MPISVNSSTEEESLPIIDPAALEPTQPENSLPQVNEQHTTLINTVEDEKRLNGVIEISDKEAPLIVLYGPTSCGKTMTLIRLTKYLREKLAYIVTPDESFRPSYDLQYKEDCEKFNDTVSNPLAQAGTTGYMLVNVIRQGKTLCKILEAPGEYYFNPNDPRKQYPHYMETIINAPNRKVWCAFVEPNWADAKSRENYVLRIAKLKPRMSPQDKMIFVFNKIDKTPFVKAPGVVNEELAIHEVSNLYPGIFLPFKCEIPIVKFFRPWDCNFVPFQSGVFTDDVDENNNKIKFYAEGPTAYPQKLWNLIKQRIS